MLYADALPARPIAARPPRPVHLLWLAGQLRGLALIVVAIAALAKVVWH